MAVPVVIYQSNRKGETKGKWYARATYTETFDLVKLAQHMQEHNTTFTRGQILAILTDIVSCIKELCLEGKKVKMDNLGFFYPSFHSKGAQTEKEFNASKDIIGLRIKFLGQGESKNALYYTQTKVAEANWHDNPIHRP
ncbi:DNA-binding protein [uncultured Prevotella sp.]|uniref:HU family DNA-binding protein n=1 Tax=uncultured Prevotella sp. TaxID=159272 RepID=UPI00261DE9A8|nr:DNA-binding protein [uncultured Prevotella sp.]